MRLLALICLLAAAPAFSQGYPTKPMRIIVNFPAGGIADIYARIIGAKVQESWGQPVVVENRTGAGGNIGAEAVAKSAARRLHARTWARSARTRSTSACSPSCRTTR